MVQWLKVLFIHVGIALAFTRPRVAVAVAHAGATATLAAETLATGTGTATLATQEVYEEGSCTEIIIASGQAFPDALSGSALAGVFGCPILLTNKLKLSPDTKSEILRLFIILTFL